jgi:hypothetical protein
VAKPEFIGHGFWASTKGVAFSTAMSTGFSFGNATNFKNKALFNASTDYPIVRSTNFVLNGALVNTAGFGVNKALERNNPDADLRSTLRQLVERVLGTGTQYIAWKTGDILAGKGEYKGKTDRLLREAREEGEPSNTEAWKVFGRRWSMDVLGLWSGRDDDRRLRFNVFQPSANLEQLRSWYTEDHMEFPGHRMQQGYLVDKAKKDPDGLREFLRQFAVEMDDPKAAWRVSSVWLTKHAEARQVYYFSLMVKHFAILYQAGKSEYHPFAEFIESSPHQKYWAAVPSCETEADLRRAFIRMEDFEEVYRPRRVGGGESLEDLLAILRASSHLAQNP